MKTKELIEFIEDAKDQGYTNSEEERIVDNFMALIKILQDYER